LRRTRTARFFDKVPDHRLEQAYITRLQRYLHEGLEANDYWDVEMIEQIIQERVPNAPWHKKAQEDFLARLQIKLQEQERQKRLPTLSPYWQNQMGALSEQMAGWPGGAQELARDLLWRWLELQKQGRSPEVIEKTIIDDIASQFEEVLRAADRANQEYCRSRSSGFIQKLARIHGDPCEPWFERPQQAGYNKLRIFKLLLRTYRDTDGVPYRSVKFWIEEYIKQYRQLTDPQLQSLRAQALTSAIGGVASRLGAKSRHHTDNRSSRATSRSFNARALPAERQSLAGPKRTATEAGREFRSGGGWRHSHASAQRPGQAGRRPGARIDRTPACTPTRLTHGPRAHRLAERR
jgi:hypothetical protein